MTQATTRKPRKREPETKPEPTRIGHFDIDYEDGYHILRSGNCLMMRTKDKEAFVHYCGLIERSRGK